MTITVIQLPGLTPTQSLVLLLAISPLLYIAYSVVYNLYFSPLSNFPGPKLWACSEFFYNRAIVQGNPHRQFLKFFEAYGPGVRIAPQELVFSSAQAHRDLYGGTHAQKQLGGKKDYLAKDERSYNSFGLKEDHMISTLDTNVHARQRRMIGTAFSERSVRDQEAMLMEYIGKLIAGIEKYSEVDIKSWINYTTFDITGYLVFGESFHCLDNAAMHPWVSFMSDSVKAQVLMGLFLRVPGMKTLFPYLMPKKAAAALAEHQQLSLQRLEQRLDEGQKTDKADLIGLLLKNGIAEKSGGFSSGEDHISKGELHANTAILIIAGSETSATLLTGALFFLLTHEKAYTRLAHEIRTAFSTVDSITALAASHLPYLHAVIQESLRMYPPTVTQFSRRTPPDGATIGGYQVPGNTYLGVPFYAANRYSANFTRPEEWIPERWLEGEARGFESDVREAMQPFSVGPYSCVGINLAWAEIRLILCHLLWHFDFELCPGQERWQEDQKVYLIWEKPELRVKAKGRKFD